MVPSSSAAVTSSVGRQAVALDDQAVVARGLERRGQAAEDALALVVDGAELAVHDLAGAHHPAAEGLADRLVAEADAEQRRPGLGGGGDQGEADAGLVRGAGAGREQDRRRVERHRRLHVDLVVAADDGLGAQFSQDSGRGCR